MAEETEVLRLGSTARRLDPAAIAQGVRKECPFRPGLFVLVLPAASYNPRFRKAIQAQRAAAADGTPPSFESRYDDPQFVAEALVADVEGIYREDGTPVEYTPELGLRILEDPGNADVREWIVTEAHSYGDYYAKQVEADAGN